MHITLTPLVITILATLFAFFQAIIVSIAPLIYETFINKKIHRVEKALPMIGRLKARLEHIRDTLDADRVSLWYFSNGEKYYTGNPAQFVNMLDERTNPSKPELASAAITMSRIPISFFYTDLIKLQSASYFLSPNDTVTKTQLSKINDLYGIVSNNAFKITVCMRDKNWKFWKDKKPLWVGTIYVQYDHVYEMEEAEVLFLQTQLAELAEDIVQSDKS